MLVYFLSKGNRLRFAASIKINYVQQQLSLSFCADAQLPELHFFIFAHKTTPMKKILSVLVVAILLLTVTGCKKKEAADPRQKYLGYYAGPYTYENGTQSNGGQDVTADPSNSGRIGLYMNGIYADLDVNTGTFTIPAQIVHWSAISTTTSWGSGSFSGNQMNMTVYHQPPGGHADKVYFTGTK